MFARANIIHKRLDVRSDITDQMKLEQLYQALPNNRTELIEAISSDRRFYNYERLP